MSPAESGQEIDFEPNDFREEDRGLLSNKKVLQNFFSNDSELLKKIFKYQPLEFNHVKVCLRNQGLRCNNNLLTAFLNKQVSGKL